MVSYVHFNTDCDKVNLIINRNNYKAWFVIFTSSLIVIRSIENTVNARNCYV